VTQNEREAERLPFFSEWKDHCMAATIGSALPSPKPSHPLLVNAYTNKKKEATLIGPESFTPLSCWC